MMLFGSGRWIAIKGVTRKASSIHHGIVQRAPGQRLSNAYEQMCRYRPEMESWTRTRLNTSCAQMKSDQLVDVGWPTAAIGGQRQLIINRSEIKRLLRPRFVRKICKSGNAGGPSCRLFPTRSREWCGKKFFFVGIWRHFQLFRCRHHLNDGKILSSLIW
jgi:hypothetical protein